MTYEVGKTYQTNGAGERIAIARRGDVLYMIARHSTDYVPPAYAWHAETGAAISQRDFGTDYDLRPIVPEPSEAEVEAITAMCQAGAGIIDVEGEE